jgi:hypothetical protein
VTAGNVPEAYAPERRQNLFSLRDLMKPLRGDGASLRPRLAGAFPAL